MKTLKVPNHYSLLSELSCTSEEAECIQKHCHTLGYNLSLKECKDLWVILNELFYNQADITLGNVQLVIRYVEQGIIWRNPQ